MKLNYTPAHLLLTVTDNGPGFSRESLAHAVDPYYSEGAAGEGHFGLGLYICRLLCQSHGGELRLQNAEKDAKASQGTEAGTSLPEKSVIREAMCPASFPICPSKSS